MESPCECCIETLGSISHGVKLKPTGKGSLGRPGRTILRMDLGEMGINTRNWVDSAQDTDYWRALANAALKLWVP